eukprot:5997389-Amphidinium_carterae.1
MESFLLSFCLSVHEMWWSQGSPRAWMSWGDMWDRAFEISVTLEVMSMSSLLGSSVSATCTSEGLQTSLLWIETFVLHCQTSITILVSVLSQDGLEQNECSFKTVLYNIGFISYDKNFVKLECRKVCTCGSRSGA